MEGLGKKVLCFAVEYAVEYLRDEEKMDSVFEYLEDRASDTDTSWDDAAVAGARNLWPAVSEMAADYLESLCK